MMGVFVWNLVLAVSVCCWMAVNSATLPPAEGQNGGHKVMGFYGGSVTLDCDLEKADPPVIAWSDEVWNMEKGPVMIYNSSKGQEISQTHLRKDFMVVDGQMRLTITDLLHGDEPDNEYEVSSAGNYFCYSRLDSGEWIQKKFTLSLAGKPVCEGESDLREGEGTELKCSVGFHGNMPKLMFERNGEEVTSAETENALSTAQTVVTVHDVTYMDDQSEYTCKMELGELVEECSIKVSVGYKVRDLQLKPDGDVLHIGETVTCSAMGNPKPALTMESNRGSKSLTGKMKIEPSWLHQLTTVKCSATNNLDGMIEIIEQSITFNVTELAKPVTGSGPDSSAGRDEPVTRVGGIIAGVVIGALVCVVIVIAIVCLRRRDTDTPKGAEEIRLKNENHVPSGDNNVA